ncbi:hypothetical protein K7711_10010 [Nocardia sp. CA2R105]|uniref:hypothetical protein n=1 Tax=Nocardia coffeae TaxID=2873381 RepID=UPI001CA73507|nr:hypothetical protein [Nocardia coffeae]MBY8856810.1 hypothetical protein [Nocardia coffeae]
MTVIGRLRRSSSALALLVAVVLGAHSAVGCMLFDDRADEHPAVESGPVSTISVVVSDFSHGPPGDSGGPCASHLAHCLPKSIPVGRAGWVPMLFSFGLLLTVAVVAAAAVMVSVGGVRGPPVAAVPAVGGRVILTRICIARR